MTFMGNSVLVITLFLHHDLVSDIQPNTNIGERAVYFY